MSQITFLLDTNFVIGLLKGSGPAVSLQASRGIQPINSAVSMITQIEVLGFPGIRPDEERRVQSFLNACALLPLNEHVARKAIEIRRGTRLKLPDAIIAATALTNGIELVTLDKAFRKKFDKLKAGTNPP